MHDCCGTQSLMIRIIGERKAQGRVAGIRSIRKKVLKGIDVKCRWDNTDWCASYQEDQRK